MYDIVALGELLIDFTPCGMSDQGMKLLEMNPGGAVANVLCAASRLGHSTAFIGKVGNDIHGRYLEGKLREYGIDPSGLIYTDAAHTTLAFVDIDECGERSFSFMRQPGADTLLDMSELDRELLSSARVVHVGSLSMTAEPSRSATIEAVKLAKAAGAVVTYDPNYRQPLWSDVAEAVVQMRSLIPYADMIKLSDNETALLTGEKAPEQAIERLLSAGVKCVVVTAGENGCFVGVDGGIVHVSSFAQRAVDTTGAGDAFWGGFLAAYLSGGKALCDITLSDAERYAVYGSAVAACCVNGRGAMPSMPDSTAVDAMLHNK